MRDAGVRGVQKGGRAGRLLANVPSSLPALPAAQVHYFKPQPAQLHSCSRSSSRPGEQAQAPT